MLRTLFGFRRQGDLLRRNRSRRIALGEGLLESHLMAVNINYTPVAFGGDGVLTITGTDENDEIVVTNEPNGAIQVDGIPYSIMSSASSLLSSTTTRRRGWR